MTRGGRTGRRRSAVRRRIGPRVRRTSTRWRPPRASARVASGPLDGSTSPEARRGLTSGAAGPGPGRGPGSGLRGPGAASGHPVDSEPEPAPAVGRRPEGTLCWGPPKATRPRGDRNPRNVGRSRLLPWHGWWTGSIGRGAVGGASRLRRARVPNDIRPGPAARPVPESDGYRPRRPAPSREPNDRTGHDGIDRLRSPEAPDTLPPPVVTER